nr:hypothetical protein [Massilia alkalitolerans]
MRFWQISMVVEITKAFRAMSPCSQKNGGSSHWSKPSSGAASFQAIQSTTNTRLPTT